MVVSPKGHELEKDCAGKASIIYKKQTLHLVREDKNETVTVKQ
jgi:hypothetical protein